MSSKPRANQGINLDEIEKHIREGSLPPSSAGAPAEDPLAELARIVGGGPVTRREPRLEPARPEKTQPPASPPQQTVAMPAWTPPSRAEQPAPRAEAAPQPDPSPFRADPPPPRSEFGTIEDDIERLLRINQRQPSIEPRRSDELENAMRSLDNLLRSKPLQPPASPPPFDDWALRPQVAEPPAPAASSAFDAELERAAQASVEPAPYPEDEPESAPEPDHEMAAAAQRAEEESVSRSRKPLFMVAAVLGVAAIGVGGALSMRDSARSVGGQPPVIVADSGPTKVAPVNPGGMQVPDQNRQILEPPPAGSKPAPKVVNSEEQPVDLREAVRREAAQAQAATAAPPRPVEPPVIVSSIPAPPPPSAESMASAPPAATAFPSAPPSSVSILPSAPPAPQPGAAETAASAPEAARPSENPEPRRVRTVAIKPPEPGAGRVETVPPLPVAPPPAASVQTPAPMAAAPKPEIKPEPKAAVAPPAAPIEAAPPAPPKPKMQGSIAASREAARQTPRAASRQAPETMEEAAAAAAGPLQITPPAARGAARPTQRMAAVEPTAPALAPAPGQEERPSGGSFVVQLASEGSDREARATITRLQSRHAELGALSSSVQQRTVRGQMRYRVRFGSLSREQASQLCASLKAKGQDCILQPN